MKDFSQLIIKMERLRKEMYRLAAEKGLAHKDVVRVSQKLDVYLNEYNKLRFAGNGRAG